MENTEWFESARPIELKFYTLKIYCDGLHILSADPHYFDMERLDKIFHQKIMFLTSDSKGKHGRLAKYTPEQLNGMMSLEYLPNPTKLPLFNNDNNKTIKFDEKYHKSYKIPYIKTICWDGYSWRYKFGNCDTEEWIIEGELISL